MSITIVGSSSISRNELLNHLKSKELASRYTKRSEFSSNDDASVKPSKPNLESTTKIKNNPTFMLSGHAEPLAQSNQDIASGSPVVPYPKPSGSPQGLVADPMLNYPLARPTGNYIEHNNGTSVPDSCQLNPSLTGPITGWESVEPLPRGDVPSNDEKLSKAYVNRLIAIDGRYQVL